MCSLYGVIGMPLLFSKIWRPLCSLFDQHGYFLFFKFTLASGVFARAGVERERDSKTSERGVGTWGWKIYRNTSRVDYPAWMGKARQMDGR